MLECVLVASSHTIINCCPAPCSCADSSPSPYCCCCSALGPYMPAHINKGRRLCAQFVCNLNSHTHGRAWADEGAVASSTTTDVACPASYSACVAVPRLLLPSACVACRLLLSVVVVVASPFCTWISTRQSKR